MAESGRSFLSLPALARLYELYGVNLTWLIAGYGPMRVQPIIHGHVDETPAVYEPQYPLVRIPIVSSFLALGEPVPQDRELVADWAEIIKPLVPHPAHTYGLKARGDSMAPVIQDRWLVLVDIHPDAIRPYEQLQGRPVVVRLQEGTSVKWFAARKDAWVIHAENAQTGFKDVRIPRQVDPPVIGRVIWWCPSV
ncbi:MAG: S24 family peptidase [Acidobacteriota bacterium]